MIKTRMGLVAMAGLAVAACTPQVGPTQAQHSAAVQACTYGDRNACYNAQALAPAAQVEAQQNAQNAAVGTAVAAGLAGAVAGAAITSAATPRYYYGPRHYYGRPYYRGW
ncbi:hypothetical protein ACE7GA_04570 [Roseomonas sp. CCTCC AB2023176]|uniref:hypothetical protein n=1 Tax=Roseomonas sp. CCTCC AB2023176 TaxID=3342640 RepID=UPI0035E3B56C